MKIPFLVVILAMAATPVFSDSSFFDFLTKIMEEPKAEPEQLTFITGNDDEGQVFGDVDISELDKEIDEILKLVDDSQKSMSIWDRILRKDEKPESLWDVLFSDKDENEDTLFDSLGKSMEVKKYFPKDFLGKKK